MLAVLKYTSSTKLQEFIGTVRMDRPVEEVVQVLEDNIQALSLLGYLDKEKFVSSEVLYQALRRVYPPKPSESAPPVEDLLVFPVSNQDIPVSVGGRFRLGETMEATDTPVSDTSFEPWWDGLYAVSYPIQGLLPLDSSSEPRSISSHAACLQTWLNDPTNQFR